jgi:hypothetical protein
LGPRQRGGGLMTKRRSSRRGTPGATSWPDWARCSRRDLAAPSGRRASSTWSLGGQMGFVGESCSASSTWSQRSSYRAPPHARAGVVFSLGWGDGRSVGFRHRHCGLSLTGHRYLAGPAWRGWPAATIVRIGNRAGQGMDGRRLASLEPPRSLQLSNYLYSLTAIAFWPYILASWLTMLPGTVLYVYLGAAKTSTGPAGRGSRVRWSCRHGSGGDRGRDRMSDRAARKELEKSRMGRKS